jgi:ferredoxin
MQQDTVRFSAILHPTEDCFDAPPDLPLLVSAEHAGVLMASSCRNGTCRTCICRLVSGSVRYLIAWPGLSAEEKREGYILPCVAYPTADVTLALPKHAGYTP